MSFGITATFPLGVYQGHRADGTPEPVLDPARLHAALLCAAAQGSRAVMSGGQSQPCPADIAALTWLEAHPPSGIRLPGQVRVTDRPLTAYRKEGVILTEAGRVVDKVTARHLSDGYALAGPVGWCWDTQVPADVTESLTALCPDVPCLGEATSPVVLRIENVEPTIRLDPAAWAFDTAGEDVRVAASGRTAGLRAAHLAANGRSPSVAADRHSTSSDRPAPSPVPTEGLHPARYRAVERAVDDAPWSQVLLVPTDATIAKPDRVRWCVAVHRALIARIGTGASSMVTGVYEPAALRPANRLAIHYLPADLMAAHGYPQEAVFALFLPYGAAAEDLGQLAAAMQGWRRVSRPGGDRAVFPERMGQVDGDALWAPKPAGLVRVWLTHPAAVPETRPVTSPGGRRWTLADAAAVSVGMVWRDALGAAGRKGPDLYRSLRTAVDDRGVRILEIAALPPAPSVRSYVHATPDGLVVQPYRARLTLGTLAGDRTAVAIGQSRHLGGGLLVPVDVPGDLVDETPV